MGTISLRRLSDKTLAKYEQLEKENKLTLRQWRALWGHRNLTKYVEAAHRAVKEETESLKRDDQ